MDAPLGLPNGELLLNLIMVTRQRLQSGSKAAVSLPILLEIIKVAVAAMPFDEAFYLSTYEDVRDARQSGQISDVKAHFVEQGYFEGRFGSRPDVDEAYYTETYPDVAAAIANRHVGSALEHYMVAGAIEGRFANARDRQCVTRWLALGGKI